MKPSVYLYAVLVAFSLSLLLLPMGCDQINVSFESAELEPSSLPPAAESSISTLPSSASTQNNQVESSSRENHNTVTTYHHGSVEKAGSLGNLRMSNQTNQLVRLALLSRRSLIKNSDTSKTNEAVSAHWDFAPQEGSQKGLILSLPNKNLELSKGDILVAFAQDGSRRYWGPYIVGETSSPSWNFQTKEWQLVISQ